MRVFRLKGYWKRIRKQQKKRFKQILRDTLKDFWRLYGKCSNEGQRLELLKGFASKTFNYSYNSDKTRKSFNKSDIGKDHEDICVVCYQNFTIRHHIIQIQNGGNNSDNNIVRLCRDCHAKIHPWLKK